MICCVVCLFSLQYSVVVFPPAAFYCTYYYVPGTAVLLRVLLLGAAMTDRNGRLYSRSAIVKVMSPIDSFVNECILTVGYNTVNTGMRI